MLSMAVCEVVLLMPQAFGFRKPIKNLRRGQVNSSSLMRKPGRESRLFARISAILFVTVDTIVVGRNGPAVKWTTTHSKALATFGDDRRRREGEEAAQGSRSPVMNGDYVAVLCPSSGSGLGKTEKQSEEAAAAAARSCKIRSWLAGAKSLALSVLGCRCLAATATSGCAISR
ncbi:hypothetical protein BJ546DRAFT_690323 [Cryomyces antarcticus]